MTGNNKWRIVTDSRSKAYNHFYVEFKDNIPTNRRSRTFVQQGLFREFLKDPFSERIIADSDTSAHDYALTEVLTLSEFFGLDMLGMTVWTATWNQV